MKIYLVTNQMKLRFIFRVTFTTSKLCIQTFCIFAFYFYHSSHRHFKEVEFFSSKILKSVFDTEKFDVYRTRVFVFVSCCLSPPKPNRKKNWELFDTEHFGINISPKPRNIFRKSAVPCWIMILDSIEFQPKKNHYYDSKSRNEKWLKLPRNEKFYHFIKRYFNISRK